MADNKSGRDKKADDAEHRQRERELREARNRDDEPEPVHETPGERLGGLDTKLEDIDYPATTREIVDSYGDQEVETQNGLVFIEEVLAPVENETYDSADDVRSRIQGLIHRG